MYLNQLCYGVFKGDTKLLIIALIFAITPTTGEFYCSEDGPFADVLEAESPEGWQQWKESDGDVYYINHKTRQMRRDNPTSFFPGDLSHQKISFQEISYPSQEHFWVRKELFVDNLVNSNTQQQNQADTTFIVNRSTVLQDSYRQFTQTGAVDDLKNLSVVEFEDRTEDLIEGPLIEEWFGLLFNEIFDERNGFFRYADQNDARMEINPDSKDASYFKFIGRIVGEAVRRQILIDVTFVKPYYQIMLGQPIQVEEEQAHTMSGRAIRQRYLTSVQDQLCAFLEGFAELILLHTLRIFSVEELQLVIAGESTIDVVDWQTNTQCDSCGKHPEIGQRFWKIVNRLNETERKRLLQFATGSSRVPVEGFSNLGPRFAIVLQEDRPIDQIPRANQDDNSIILSNYSSEEEMEKKLKMAITRSV